MSNLNLNLIGNKIDFNIPDKYRLSNIKIITTLWNDKHVSVLVEKVKAELKKYGIAAEVVKVPGCFEMPQYIAKQVASQFCYICVGVLMKGVTDHHDYVARSVYDSFLDLSTRKNIYIINGVLTCLNEEQVVDKVNSDLAETWALSAISVMDL